MMKINADFAASKLYDYANVWYKWGGQDKQGIDCSGYVAEWWEDIGFKSEGFDATADSMYDNFRSGAWPGTKLDKPKFGSLVFYGPSAYETGTNAGHVVIGLCSTHIIGANGGGSSVDTVSEAKARYAFVKVQPVNYRADMLGIWMPDYEFVNEATPTPAPMKRYKTTTNVNLRQAPSLSGAILVVIPSGETITGTQDAPVLAGGYTWVKVVYGSFVGWVANKNLVTV
jgi:hypothetical protein